MYTYMRVVSTRAPSFLKLSVSGLFISALGSCPELSARRTSMAVYGAELILVSTGAMEEATRPTNLGAWLRSSWSPPNDACVNAGSIWPQGWILIGSLLAYLDTKHGGSLSQLNSLCTPPCNLQTCDCGVLAWCFAGS